MEQDRERALAQLSMTALVLDLLVVLLLSLSAIVLMASGALGRTVANLPQIFSWGVPIVVGLAYFLAVESVLGGLSIGRIALGLRFEDVERGGPAALKWRLARLTASASTAGIRSANPQRVPAYNRRARCCLRSDWVGAVPPVSRPISSPVGSGVGGLQGTPPSAGRFVAISGPGSGSSIDFDQMFGRSKDGTVAVGRDPQRAQMLLASDTKVSRVHARIARRGGQFYIVDGSGARNPSTHGTFVNGRRIPSDKPTALPPGATIKLGETTVTLQS